MWRVSRQEDKTSTTCCMTLTNRSSGELWTRRKRNGVVGGNVSDKICIAMATRQPISLTLLRTPFYCHANTTDPIKFIQTGRQRPEQKERSSVSLCGYETSWFSSLTFHEETRHLFCFDHLLWLFWLSWSCKQETKSIENPVKTLKSSFQVREHQLTWLFSWLKAAFIFFWVFRCSVVSQQQSIKVIVHVSTVVTCWVLSVTTPTVQWDHAHGSHLCQSFMFFKLLT